MSEYAANTKVEVEKTQADIAALLTKYGCQGFAVAWSGDREALEFVVEQRQIRFEFRRLDASDLDQEAIAKLMRAQNWGRERAAERFLAQARRVQWRQLFLGIKAKLVLVDAQIATIEQEFFANVVLPNNQTMYDWAAPQLALRLPKGTMPPMLPGGKGQGN